MACRKWGGPEHLNFDFEFKRKEACVSDLWTENILHIYHMCILALKSLQYFIFIYSVFFQLENQAQGSVQHNQIKFQLKTKIKNQ